MPEQVNFDPRNKYVKVVELRPDGFVEFEFAVGEPELFVEMILPATAFDDFCQLNRVIFLEAQKRSEAPQDEADEAAGARWSLRDANRRRIGPA